MPAWGSARRVKPFHGNVADGTAAPRRRRVERTARAVSGRDGWRARAAKAHAPTPADIVSDPPAPPGALATKCCDSASSPSPEARAAKAPRGSGAGARVPTCRYACACARPRCRSSSNPRTRTTRGQDKARFGGSSQPGVLLFLRRLPRFFLVVAGSPARNVVNGARVGVHCLERARPGRRDPGRHRVSGTRAGARSQMERRHPKGGVHGARELQRTGGPRR